MTYFLERIAKHLYDQTGGDLRQHCLVFPNRRAGLYFLKYLAAQINKPVWTPAIMTINDFFASLSPLQLAENEILLSTMYSVYRKLVKHAESFDDFYFWGDMLINDFDDTDKYMADARVLFRNVQDFKDIDSQFGDIESWQAEIIKRFWTNFEPEKPSAEKSGFKSVWSILNDLYTGFRDVLRSGNIAYEGMIFRDVAESALSGEKPEIKWEKVHFIGFNALNRCEETIMKYLQDQGRAKFYWDYDNSYLKGGKLNSAGLFLGRNLKYFRNDMPDDWNYDTLLSAGTGTDRIKIIETTSDIAQVKLIPDQIVRIPGISPENAHHTAVILADENLLVPVLTSLPENIGDINISMGYPLKMTGVYTLVKCMLNFQRNTIIENGISFHNYRDVTDILRHELIESLLPDEEKKIALEIVEKNLARIPSGFLERSEILKMIFRIDSDPSGLSGHLKEILVMVSSAIGEGEERGGESGMKRNIRNEFIYRVLLSINRLESLLHSSEISFKTETYIRILDRILRSQSVPFSGEPLSGIQIMGILETRALDFENIIVLSVNEGVLPAMTSGSSFIPFSIREAFGLPTINHQESIFAYHFYRLLHRAKRATLVYNSNSEGLRTGEMSRFIIQMKYEQVAKPEILNLTFNVKTPVAVGPVVERTGRHSDGLISQFDETNGKKELSPTAINTWLNCRMRFYYRYVNGLKEPEKVSAVIDHAVFGRILHNVMRKIYAEHTGQEVSREKIDSLIKNEVSLYAIIDHAFREETGCNPIKAIDGNELIIRDILLVYLIRILKADRLVAPFVVTGLEKAYFFRLPVEFEDGMKITVRTGGKVDRIDVIKGKTRIVDYKTGTVSTRITSTDDLFVDDRKREQDGWLQTMLYCEAYLSANPGLKVRPSIYRVKELSGENFSDMLLLKPSKDMEILLDDYSLIREEFMDGLKNLISVIFGKVEPFVMTKSVQKCGYCPYRGLCQR